MIMKTFLTLLMLLSSTHAFADDALSSDRPGRASSPTTVSVGHLQVEADGINYVQNYKGNVRSYQFADPTLKYGLTDRVDVEVGIGGLVVQNGRRAYGDTTLAVKFMALHTDAVVIAVIPTVKIPTAKNGFGNGHLEYQVAVPIQFSLPNDFSLTVQPNVAVVRNVANQGYRMNFSGAVNVSRVIIGDLSGFVELYANKTMDTSPTQVSFDTGVAYLINKSLQLDAGVNIGLNRSSGIGVYCGISYRY